MLPRISAIPMAPCFYLDYVAVENETTCRGGGGSVVKVGSQLFDIANSKSEHFVSLIIGRTCARCDIFCTTGTWRSKLQQGRKRTSIS